MLLRNRGQYEAGYTWGQRRVWFSAIGCRQTPSRLSSSQSHLRMLWHTLLSGISKECLKHYQRPKWRTVIALAGQMITHEFDELCPVEYTGVGQNRSENRTFHVSFERPTEPTPDRNGETHFSTIKNIIRQKALKRFLEHILPFTAL